MHRRQPYRPVNPLTGIWAPRGNALYRYASPDGDGRSCEISTTHPLARHSATHAVTCGHNLPQLCGGNSSDHYSLIPAHSSYTFSAKEKDSETGLSYFGLRYYSSDLSIWLSVDPMADKYPSMSPYVYCANNPVRLVDPNGEEIVLETIYKKDANGNDTKEIERYNIRITGKIINTSQTRINTQEARDEIVSQIESSFSGVTKKGIPVTTTADFEVVNSLQDVRKSDHLIILSNGVNLGDFDNPYGKVDQIGGRKAWVDANLFIGLSGLLTKKGAKTAAHEMGHLLGLEHSSAKGLRNLMNSHYFGGSKISSHQLSIIIHLLKIDKNIKTPSLKHVNKQ